MHFRCVSDNATAETKNNCFLKLLGVMVGRGNVTSAVLCQGRVGHTHNRQDASFSHVATVLSKAKVLQDPDEFKERIHQNLMDYHVETVHAVMDFQTWLMAVGTRITDLNQTKEATKKNLEACHSYKLVRRESLPPNFQAAIQVPDFLKGVEQNSRDVILLSKLYMASKNLSQAPIVFLPWAWLCKLSPRPCDIPIPRHKFSERQSGVPENCRAHEAVGLHESSQLPDGAGHLTCCFFCLSGTQAALLKMLGSNRWPGVGL